MKNRYDMIIPLEREEKAEFTVSIDGLFMYRNNTSAYESVKNFVTEFVNGRHDFNESYGAYRFSMIRKKTGEKVFFSDNSGMMRFYINQISGRFFCSLSEAMSKEKRKPNYSAIAQFLSFGCVYSYETIVESVVLSNPNCYYLSENDHLTEKKKGLKAFSEYANEDFSLNSLIKKALAHCDDKVGCTITGGIDSRSVLANLINIGVKPDLAITGHEPQPDVEIAKKISKTTGLNLAVIPDEIDENTWLEHAIEAADGQDGICGIYRLDKLARHLNNNGITLQFGGVAGEMYKNSFINQDFPVYFGNPRWSRFYHYKVGTFDFDMSLFSQTMQGEITKLSSIIIAWLKSHYGDNKADSYLEAGYEIMQARCNHVINMFQRYTTVYNPLMERKMAAYAYGKNPYALEMQAFQRKEVSLHCKIISNIETDRGLTCNTHRKAAEFIKSNFFLAKVALQRLLFRKKIDMRIDQCFATGHKDESFLRALENTQRLGVLNSNVEIEKVPVGLADRLFTIGLLFDSIE